MKPSFGQIPRRWSRLGRIFPSENQETPCWMGSYASLPYPLPLEGSSAARVFFSGRDPQNRANIGAVTVDLQTLKVIQGSLTQEPLLAPGTLGSFDDSGATVSCIVPNDGKLYLYYTGWSLGKTVPFYFAIGLAVSADGGQTFERYSPAPILGRHPVDPYLCASPSVLIEDGRWRMWYISGERWEQRPEGPRHYYLIRYAESQDGIHWTREGHVSISFRDADEYAMGRPHVVHEAGGYHMWFCSRGMRYRLEYAQSSDGHTWFRDGRTVCLEPGPSDWERNMQAYPSVLEQDGHWWLFYNGNRYGATGFGLAKGILP